MGSLRDQIIENADRRPEKAFIFRLSNECQSMIAEGMLLYRHGELPLKTMAELNRSLQRIAEKQYQEDYAKWPDQGTFKRLYDRLTDQELQEIVDKAKPPQSQKVKRRTSRNK
jgi:hypothetical protein